MRARVSFFAPRKDGSEVFVGAGQEVEDSEIIRGREALFEPSDDEPVRKPAKKAAKKTAAKK